MYKGEYSYLGDVLTMVIHHLQVMGWSSKYQGIRRDYFISHFVNKDPWKNQPM